MGKETSFVATIRISPKTIAWCLTLVLTAMISYSVGLISDSHLKSNVKEASQPKLSDTTVRKVTSLMEKYGSSTIAIHINEPQMKLPKEKQFSEQWYGVTCEIKKQFNNVPEENCVSKIFNSGKSSIETYVSTITEVHNENEPVMATQLAAR